MNQFTKSNLEEGNISITEEALIATGRQKSQTYIMNTATTELIEKYASEHELSQSDVIEMAMDLFKEKYIDNWVIK